MSSGDRMMPHKKLLIKYLAVLEEPRQNDRPRVRRVIVEAIMLSTAASVVAATHLNWKEGERIILVKEFGQ